MGVFFEMQKIMIRLSVRGALEQFENPLGRSVAFLY